MWNQSAWFWVIGLGNPGVTYQHTRHNVGFMVLDALATRNQVRFRKNWLCRSSCGAIDEKKMLLVKPQTYMNHSGLSAGRLKFWKKVSIERLVVVVDDVSLPPGRVRVRKKGRAGGHNGLKSLIDTLGTEEFMRVRVGIGSCGTPGGLVDYVLSDFGVQEWPQVKEGIEKAANAVECIIGSGVESAMNMFN